MSVSNQSVLVRLTTVLISALALNGCVAKSEAPKQRAHGPMVSALETATLPEQPTAVSRLALIKRDRQAMAARHSSGFRFAGDMTPVVTQPAIQGTATFIKSEIFNRDFLFGADLQYSSIGEDGMDLLMQSLAVGHITSHFTQVGDRLQLVADQKYLFMSDINHPERLIHEFPVVAEDATTITVAVRSASPVLVTLLGGSKSPAARQTWVRSVEFVAQGNYLLIESSVEQSDGSVAEFMESVFPRETLVPTGAQPKVLLADPDLEPLASRFRLLGGDPLYIDLPTGRTRTLVASRFPSPSAGQTIDWYVTPNVPAIYLPLIKAGVEGWNRYSQKMWARDFVAFKGVLPADVKIGDPRYNVINWDSVPEAGAAYESQASDPLTGLQSHSLIYLPYAWVKIGEEYWNRGGLSAEDTVTPAMSRFMASGSILGESLKVRCLHDIEMSAPLEARTSPEVFARALLKQVLFHEVGHALGLAHNFKGSLSWNPTDSGTVFSSSIMDYNQYQIEDGAYESETSSNGFLLEYDRQIISALYNDGKDIAETDLVMPACDDDEADAYRGGVDPLCLRYDAGEDPTVQLARTIELVTNPAAKIGPTQSLANALLEARSSLGDAAALSTEAEVTERLRAFANLTSGLLTHYYASGAQSLGSMAKNNAKALYTLADDVLPAPYDQNAMFARAMAGVQYTLNATALEPATAAALMQAREFAEQWAKATTWYTSSAQPNKETGVAAKLKRLNDAVDQAFVSAILPKARASVMGALVYRAGVSFAFSLDQTPTIDAEKTAMELLEKAVTDKLATGAYRPMSERTAAANALRTFTPVPGSQVVYDRIAAVIGGHLAAARTADERMALRNLLKVIQTAPAPARNG